MTPNAGLSHAKKAGKQQVLDPRHHQPVLSNNISWYLNVYVFSRHRNSEQEPEVAINCFAEEACGKRSDTSGRLARLIR